MEMLIGISEDSIVLLKKNFSKLLSVDESGSCVYKYSVRIKIESEIICVAIGEL